MWSRHLYTACALGAMVASCAGQPQTSPCTPLGAGTYTATLTPAPGRAGDCTTHPFAGKAIHVAYFGNGTGALAIDSGTSGACASVTPGCSWFESVCAGVLLEDGYATVNVSNGITTCGDAYTTSPWQKE